MTLETVSHVFGVLGILTGLFVTYLAHRKKLLNTGLTVFREQYRVEMDDFKKNVLSMVNMFREMMNKNDEKHTDTLNRFVELYEKTSRSVSKQANVCELLQVKKEGEVKLEKEWKLRMKKELDQVQEDVKHIKKAINGKT